MAVRLIERTHLTRRVGKRGPGGIVGIVRIDAEEVDWNPDGKRAAKEIAQAIARRIADAILTGRSGSFVTLPPLHPGTIRRREQRARQIREGRETPALRVMYRVRGQDPLAAPDLNPTTPAHFTGGFARSIRAFPASTDGLVYRVVAARIYDELQQRYADRGFVLLDVPQQVRSEVDAAMERYFASAFRRAGAELLETVREGLEEATAAGEGDLGGAESGGLEGAA